MDELDLEKKYSQEEIDELFKEVPHNHEDAEKIGYSDYSYWKSVFQNFLKNKPAVILLILFIVLVVFSFIALSIGKHDLSYMVADNKFIKPNGEFWFGTDNLGRDYWARVWYACQISIRLALVVALGEAVIGVAIGCLWGYVRSLDRPLTELYNLINNIPTIIYMTLVSFILGRSFWSMAGALIMFGWLGMARNIRNLVIMYRDREYNLASRCLGTPVLRILTKNLVPYLISVIILRLALSIPNTIGLESTLSYLGLGLDDQMPSLGLLLSRARTSFMSFPYLLIFPAGIVSIITITFYLVGNAFSDASDPRNHV